MKYKYIIKQKRTLTYAKVHGILNRFYIRIGRNYPPTLSEVYHGPFEIVKKKMRNLTTLPGVRAWQENGV